MSGGCSKMKTGMTAVFPAPICPYLERCLLQLDRVMLEKLNRVSEGLILVYLSFGQSRIYRV